SIRNQNLLNLDLDLDLNPAVCPSRVTNGRLINFEQQPSSDMCPSQREDEEVLDGEDEEQRRSSREAFLKITLDFLRRMKQEELADCLQSKIHSGVCRHKLKSHLQKKFQCVFEGIAKARKPNPF
ncbi:hypothetical protein L3Q82_010098, partial [Scortum barcoo]